MALNISDLISLISITTLPFARVSCVRKVQECPPQDMSTKKCKNKCPPENMSSKNAKKMFVIRYVDKKMQMSATRYVRKNTIHKNGHHKILWTYLVADIYFCVFCGHILWQTFVYLSDTTDPKRTVTLESDVWYNPKGPGAHGTKNNKFKTQNLTLNPLSYLNFHPL